MAVGCAATALVTAVRWALYGEWLPNTFYAKSSDSRWLEIQDGLTYVGRVFWNGAGPTWVGAALVLTISLVSFRLVALWGKAAGRNVAFLAAMGAAYAAGVVLSGGDSYEGARLFMPVAIPWWLALGCCGASSAHDGESPRASWPEKVGPAAVAALLLVAAVGHQGGALLKRPWTLVTESLAAVAAGPVGLSAFEGDAAVFTAVAKALEPNDVFAHLHTQRYRWFAPSAGVLDLTGLTDHRVARMPSAGRNRFGRAALQLALDERVGALHLDPQRSRITSLVDAPDLAAALSDPAVAGRYLGEPYLAPRLAASLAEHYLAASRSFPGGGGYFNLLIRRDLAGRFRDQGFRVAGE